MEAPAKASGVDDLPANTGRSNRGNDKGDMEPRVSLGTQSVRLATTMTGGVSLAIWMGGVSRELNLLQQASQWRSRLRKTDPLPSLGQVTGPENKLRALYLTLLDLLDVSVDVDVLSGASAGGINAALLGYARVHGKDLGSLRGLWLNLGSLIGLLRDPRDQDVASLMYGDRNLFKPVAEALTTLSDALPLPPRLPSVIDESPLPTKLFITTTLLNGEISRVTDSFDTIVQDVDHHGLFVFRETELIKPGSAIALGLAARSSAAFPAAFEPSFLPFDSAVDSEPAVPARPPMRAFANITRAHWVADGGLLDNQPIGPLLEEIFDRSATRAVRRVLLYVVPSTGNAPDPLQEMPGDDVTKPFGLIDGLMKDLAAVTSQSIATDLRRIRDQQ
jgi:patatin-related protein